MPHQGERGPLKLFEEVGGGNNNDMGGGGGGGKGFKIHMKVRNSSFSET